jgi:hypothetical protein
MGRYLSPVINIIFTYYSPMGRRAGIDNKDEAGWPDLLRL